MTNFLTATKVTWAAILLWFEFLVKPTFSLFGVLMAAIAIDFLTGIVKAKFKKEARTSEGYRKTVTKLLQYIVPVIILWGASTYIPEYSVRLKQASGWVTMFIIYIEVTSIFENLYEIDKKSVISRVIYRPMLTILKIGLENNAINQAAKEVKNEKATQ